MKKREISREIKALRTALNAAGRGGSQLVGRVAALESKLAGCGIGTIRDRFISAETSANDLRHEITMKLSEISNLDTAIRRLTARMAEVDDLAGKITWLHERVDLLATRLENMRGNVTLDDAAAKRLTFAVGQFSARLDRLEAPARRKRKPKTEPTPNGEAAA